MIQITGKNGKKDGKLIFFFTAREEECYGLKQFHWIPVAKILGYPAYFIRDVSNGFYEGGEIAPICRLLKGVVNPAKKKGIETVFVGSSMGGYGAIKMANTCRPDKVIAFAPTPQRQNGLKCLVPTEIHICKDSKWNEVNGYTDPENARLFEGARVIEHEGTAHNCAGVLKDRGELVGVFE